GAGGRDQRARGRGAQRGAGAAQGAERQPARKQPGEERRRPHRIDPLAGEGAPRSLEPVGAPGRDHRGAEGAGRRAGDEPDRHAGFRERGDGARLVCAFGPASGQDQRGRAVASDRGANARGGRLGRRRERRDAQGRESEDDRREADPRVQRSSQGTSMAVSVPTSPSVSASSTTSTTFRACGSPRIAPARLTNFAVISSLATGLSASPRTTDVVRSRILPPRNTSRTWAVGASARRGDTSGSGEASPRRASARMRSSASAFASNAEGSVRPSTSEAETAQGMENRAASELSGAGSPMRTANGIVTISTFSTSPASSRCALRSAATASRAKWLNRQP